MTRKTDDSIKAASIRLRMSAADKAVIEERANDRKLTVTEYLTRAGLGRATRQRPEVDAINTLRLCVDELKGIHAMLRTIAGGHRLNA